MSLYPPFYDENTLKIANNLYYKKTLCVTTNCPNYNYHHIRSCAHRPCPDGFYCQDNICKYGHPKVCIRGPFCDNNTCYFWHVGESFPKKDSFGHISPIYYIPDYHKIDRSIIEKFLSIKNEKNRFPNKDTYSETKISGSYIRERSPVRKQDSYYSQESQDIKYGITTQPPPLIPLNSFVIEKKIEPIAHRIFYSAPPLATNLKTSIQPIEQPKHQFIEPSLEQPFKYYYKPQQHISIIPDNPEYETIKIINKGLQSENTELKTQNIKLLEENQSLRKEIESLRVEKMHSYYHQNIMLKSQLANQASSLDLSYPIQLLNKQPEKSCLKKI